MKWRIFYKQGTRGWKWVALGSTGIALSTIQSFPSQTLAQDDATRRVQPYETHA